MKYLFVLLSVLVFACEIEHNEIEMDPLTKSYICHDLLKDIKGDKNALFIVYPEICGMCTEKTVDFINGFSLDGYVNCVALTVKNELTEKLTLSKEKIVVRNRLELERHGLNFATGHLFLIERDRIVYSHTVSDEDFDVVKDELTIF